VAVFLVERFTPSLSGADVAAAVRRLVAVAQPGVRHIGTVRVPDEDTCLSLFAAGSAASVAAANQRAGFVFSRIIAVDTYLEMPAQGS
jgi:hypothetical protein